MANLWSQLLDTVFPHDYWIPTAGGVRPGSDAATSLLRHAIRTSPVSSNQGRIYQAAVRSPGKIRFDTGSLADARAVTTATPLEQRRRISNITVDPQQMFLDTTVPHEFIHAMRVNKGLATRNPNLEESVARVALPYPLVEWAGRQFDESMIPMLRYEPMQLKDQPMLMKEYEKSLK